jgi:hypothetical protein
MLLHKFSHVDHVFTDEQWDHIFAEGRAVFRARTGNYETLNERGCATLPRNARVFVHTFELPDYLGTATNELYGPSAGDPPVPEADVYYAQRGDRAWVSRLVTRPKRPTRFVRMIAGPHQEACSTCNGEGNVTCVHCAGSKTIKHPCILYTAYGVAALDTPASPKEPGDLSAQITAIAGTVDATDAKLTQLWKQLEEAQTFWAQHALATEMVP